MAKRTRTADGPGIIPSSVAANLLMIDGPTLVALSREGWFKPLAPDRWRLIDVVQGYVKYLQDRAAFATTDEMANELSVSNSQVWLLHEQGHLPTPQGTGKRKKWPRLECHKGYNRFREEQTKKNQRGSAEARVRDARARDLEIRSALRLRDLIPMHDAELALDTVCGITRTVIGGAPARISRELTVQRKAESVLDECLRQISDGLAKAADALKEGDDPSLSTGAIDA